jgi:hypothetical protein
VSFTVSGVLGEAWDLYTRHSGRLIGVGAFVFGFLSAIQAAINSAGERALIPLSIGITIFGALWLQGALVIVVEDIRDGKVDLTIGQVFRRVEPRLWALLGTGILAAVGIVAGLTLFILPGLVLITYWSLLIPAVVLERKSVFEAFSRSQRLVSGDFLRVFAVVALTVILASIIGAMILALLSPLPAFFDVYVAGVIANSITIPFVALAWTLMYYELRAIKG